MIYFKLARSINETGNTYQPKSSQNELLQVGIF